MKRIPDTGTDGSGGFKRARNLVCGKLHRHFVEAFDAQVKVNHANAAEFHIDIVKQHARLNQT